MIFFLKIFIILYTNYELLKYIQDGVSKKCVCLLRVTILQYPHMCLSVFYLFSCGVVLHCIQYVFTDIHLFFVYFLVSFRTTASCVRIRVYNVIIIRTIQDLAVGPLIN